MSSDSESDEEYVPGKPEQLSEEESADDETEKQYEQEVEQKSKKRKSIQATQNNKKRKTSNGQSRSRVESDKEENGETEVVLNPEIEKKKEDDLWAMFLEGTDTPKPKANEPTKKAETLPATSTSKITSIKTTKSEKSDAQSKESRIFEFAGEKVVVENNVIKEVIKATPSTATSPAGSKPLTAPIRARGSGGLSDLLGQLNKKNKLSTLEKTKLDWETFKKNEGIEEELQTFNKGKDGYLERQDFLERADHRQFELERELRTTRRSNR